MKKYEFYVSLIICVLAIFTSVSCGGGGGGGSSSVSLPVPVSVAAPDSAPTPTPAKTASPPNKGVLITISMPDNSAYAVIACPTDYPGDNNDLRYTADDGIDLKNVLIGSAFWNNANVNIQSDVHVTKSVIQEAVNNARAALADDGLFIFFYSGHGTNSGTTAYIIPYDGISDVSKRISQDDLRAWLNEFSAAVKKYVLIDACNSGYFIDKKLKGPDTVYMKPKLVKVEGFDPNYKGENFAKSIVGSPNTYVMTASRGNQLSWEIGGAIQNGIFSYYLCHGLGIGAAIGPADADASDTIMAEELTVYAPPLVSAYVTANVSSDDQNPQSYDNYPGNMRIK